MAVLYEDNGGLYALGSGNAIVDYPSTVNANDILILAVLNDVNCTFTTPSGWAVIQYLNSSNASIVLYWKRATGSESGTETVIPDISPGQIICGIMSRFSGCKTTGTPFEATEYYGIAVIQDVPAPEITTLGVNRLVVNFILEEDNWGYSVADNYIERYEELSGVGSGATMYCQTQAVATATTVPEETTIKSIASSDYTASVSIALVP